MKAPIVQQYMTRVPMDIEQVDNVAHARRLMERLDIRHVPVMRGLRLEGVVSDRDITRAMIEHGGDIESLCIGEICQRDVLAVGPLMPIDEVARQMIDRAVGSAIVVDGRYVVGIFTTTDALKLITEIFS